MSSISVSGSLSMFPEAVQLTAVVNVESLPVAPD